MRAWSYRPSPTPPSSCPLALQKGRSWCVVWPAAPRCPPTGPRHARRRGDGVPLFIERAGGRRPREGAPANGDTEVPAHPPGSALRRLDRLGPVPRRSPGGLGPRPRVPARPARRRRPCSPASALLPRWPCWNRPALLITRYRRTARSTASSGTRSSRTRRTPRCFGASARTARPRGARVLEERFAGRSTSTPGPARPPPRGRRTAAPRRRVVTSARRAAGRGCMRHSARRWRTTEAVSPPRAAAPDGGERERATALAEHPHGQRAHGQSGSRRRDLCRSGSGPSRWPRSWVIKRSSRPL